MFPQIQPNKKRWLARKIIPLAQQGTVTDNPPFSHNGRNAATASIIDAWALVIAIPLFTSVGLQQNITPPPLVNPTVQTTIHANWPQPAWDAQTTRKIAIGALPSQLIPFSRIPASPITQWPQPDWPVQTAPHTPQPPAIVATIPVDRWSNVLDAWSLTTTVPLWSTVGTQAGADVQYPKVSYTNDGRVASMVWEPLTWDTQTTRKAPQAAAVPAPPGPTPHRPYVELGRWMTIVPMPLWSSLGVQASTPVVVPPPPTNTNIETLLGTWPQPAWDTQVTRKTPIPNVPAVPFTNASYQAINQWIALEWPTQVTRKFPVPSQAPQVDSPPIRLLQYPAISRWYDRPTQALWRTIGTYDGPSVGPADNPPPHTSFQTPIDANWETRPPQAVWFSRLIDLSSPQPFERTWLSTVLDTWTPLSPLEQQRRPRVTPSGVLVIDNPPFSSRRPQLPVYDANWPQPTWPSQRAPFVVQPGIDPPSVTDLMRRRHLDVITRMWETIPDVQQRRPTANPQAVLFRRTLSQLGTGVGHRQPHGWT